MAMFPYPAQPAFSVISDAPGSWGCGAWSRACWFQFEWPQGVLGHHIAYKELFAGLLAIAVWGKQWRGSHVQWRCDNQAAVHAVTIRSCRDHTMMHLIRCLFFLEAWFEFKLIAAHLPGRENTLADDLSRNRKSHFLSGSGPDPNPLAAGVAKITPRVGYLNPGRSSSFLL